jgi:hypothetical protein
MKPGAKTACLADTAAHRGFEEEAQRSGSMEGSSVVDDERRARAEETRDGEVRCWWIKQRLWRAVEASAETDGSSSCCFLQERSGGAARVKWSYGSAGEGAADLKRRCDAW